MNIDWFIQFRENKPIKNTNYSDSALSTIITQIGQFTLHPHNTTFRSYLSNWINLFLKLNYRFCMANIASFKLFAKICDFYEI